jgi:excinuclease ABC subunit C
MSLYSEKVKESVKKFPDSPGVYLMRNLAKEIIYVGKATSLRKRVGSYFNRALNTKTEKLVSEIVSIDFKETESVLEALILEANLINRYKPKYNIKLKDDKYFVNIIITKAQFPQLLIIRASDEHKKNAKYVFGPFTSKQEARKVVDILARIFFKRGGGNSTEKLYRQYYVKGYASGKMGEISKVEYAKTISYIKSFLEGKKTSIVKRLEGEMKKMSKAENFEKAAEIRDQIFALNHIRDVAFMNKDDLFLEKNEDGVSRIEGYDISNISGEFAVGSMVVFRKGRSDKDEYRKFKIKKVEGPNDIAMMQEVLTRRLANDWPLPDLIVMDGGIGQINVAKMVLSKYGLEIPIVGIAKGPDRKGEKLFFSGPKGFIFPDVELIKKVRDESHRFAISYHRKLRKDF